MWTLKEKIAGRPASPDDFRLLLVGVSVADFGKLIAASNIEPIDRQHDFKTPPTRSAMTPFSASHSLKAHSSVT